MRVAGRGSVWLERTAGGREVAGSNPVAPSWIKQEIPESPVFLLQVAMSARLFLFATAKFAGASLYFCGNTWYNCTCVSAIKDFFYEKDGSL